MRILVAGSETARLLTNIRNGLEALGHDVETCLCTNPSPLYGDIEYNHRVPHGVLAKRFFVDKEGWLACEPLPLFYEFVEGFDVFIFISCFTLLPACLDLPLLKKLGKKVIVRGTGSDLRFIYPSVVQWNHFGRAFPLAEADIAAMQDMSQSYASPQTFFEEKLVYKFALAPKLYLANMISLYADALLTGPSTASLITTPYFCGVGTVNSEGINTKIWGRTKPIVLHAPTNAVYKSSEIIMQALQTLKQEGVPFELVRVDKIPNAHLKKLLYSADILVDDVSYGGHGILSGEAMLSGCAVLGTNAPACQPLPRNRPVIPLDKKHILARLRRAILDVPFRKRVAEYGVEYMASGLHTPTASAQYTLDSLQRAAEKDYDYYSTLFLDLPYWPDYRGFLEKVQGELYGNVVTASFSRQREHIPGHVILRLVQSIMRRGVPPHWNAKAFADAGFLGDKVLSEKFLPRWNMEGARQVNPWLWLGKNASYGYPDQGCIPYEELCEGLE